MIGRREETFQGFPFRAAIVFVSPPSENLGEPEPGGSGARLRSGEAALLVGVISDSHDHLPNLRRALKELKAAGVTAIFHCGDLISPFVTRELGTAGLPVHTVFGNNDADRFLAEKVRSQQAGNVTHHGEFGFVEIDGHRIGLTHYKEYARGLAASGQCDAAFFGHTHQYYEERIGRALVLNPGELLGLMGPPSYCIYDTARRTVERVVFESQPW